MDGGEGFGVVFPAADGPVVDRFGHVVVGGGEDELVLGFLMAGGLLWMPDQTEEFSDAPAFGGEVGDDVFIARFKPVKPAEVAQAQPDVHEIGIVAGGAFEAEEIDAGGVEADVQEAGADEDIARIAQGDDDFGGREQAQPLVER